ncbi:hybrid histidine kinase/response regulator HrmK [Okeanomitos corallinicola TIOX110]|uniref:histidine kinase n=1 Tax=Okeanomitos corallinicola TIOX110 TaxID=3133117 RepID=A0ABZ2UWB5_9CYAN
MQQSSSLPEHNTQIDGMSQLLQTNQQLQDHLWLESSLNQLQSRLNDLLVSVNTLQQIISTEVEIMQTVVNEVAKALNNGKLGLIEYVVGIAQCQPQELVGKISYLCSLPTTEKTNPLAKSKPSKKPGLKLHAVIKLEDLQEMENQEPATAWRLGDNSSNIMTWLIIAQPEINSHCVDYQCSFNEVRSQFIHRTVEYFNTALAQLRQIQFWQQRCQQLANFNQELERTNQLKNQFLANTSHEIRTPLSSIIGFTHLLLAQGYEPERQRHQEYLHIIQSSGKHLLELINDILDLSKIEANQLEVQWEIIDVPILCKNVLALVKEKAANKGLKLCLEISDDVTNLLADPLRLKQMLLNLLFNAVKFTKSGSVGLRVETQNLYLKFTVWDTGIGISQENQSLLFRPYSQIIDPGADSNEGTGLGLMVTQQLAQIHGGYLELESEVNQGSEFTIILPLQPAGKVIEAIEAKAQQDLELQQRKSNVYGNPSCNYIPSSLREIVLVEDDLANAELIRIYLGRLGYHVTCVKNATAMWDILPQINPAVILMDVILPDENGLSLVEQLRKHPQYQNIHIVAQTAMAMKGDRETCLAAGFDDYISKPIDLEILGGIVAKYSRI